jgi:dienelactone hydrolase
MPMSGKKLKRVWHNNSERGLKKLIQTVIKAIVFSTILSATPAGAHHTPLPEDMGEVQATWLWGLYTVPASITVDNSPYWYSYPHTEVNRINNPAWTEAAGKHIRPGAKAPAVLLLHGCAGLARGPGALRVFLLRQGYAIFEPDSFARPGRSCNRTTLFKRTEELAYALEMIRQLSWVDRERIVLMGVSQGGAAVAQWSDPGFSAHIILADNCGGEKPSAPEDTPVLAIIGEKDSLSRGVNCDIRSQSGRSRSIIIPEAGHEISDVPETLTFISGFLNQP